MARNSGPVEPLDKVDDLDLMRIALDPAVSEQERAAAFAELKRRASARETV